MLSGIQVSAGPPRQNVGAYGVEVADWTTRVRLLDRGTGDVQWVPAENPVQLPAQRAEELVGRDGAGGGVRTCRRRTVGAHPTPNWLGHWGLRPGIAPTRFVYATRCSDCGRPKGMVLDEADHDTWSVGSFSPTRWWTPGSSSDL